MQAEPNALRYVPTMETPEPDEESTTRALVETLRKISETTYRDGGHALRSVHAKSHGLLDGELEVLPNLPRELAQGLCAMPGRYPVVMRLSTIPGDILDDSVSVPRGLALKILGVEGSRLSGSENDKTQDFVLVDAPSFNSPNAKMFLANLKLLAASTDKVEGLKKVVSAVMRGVESVLEAFGTTSPVVVTLGGHPQTHILGETFYSQAPILWGDYVAKIAVAPVSPELVALVKAPLNANSVPNSLREAVIEFFARNGGTWELRVQLCTDLEAMPIENAKTIWPEDQSPYLAVARIVVPPQPAWNEARAKQIDDGLAFSPWHGLAAHRPLGSIMRVRKAAYEMSARFRGERNGVTITEPKASHGAAAP